MSIYRIKVSSLRFICETEITFSRKFTNVLPNNLIAFESSLLVSKQPSKKRHMAFKWSASNLSPLVSRFLRTMATHMYGCLFFMPWYTLHLEEITPTKSRSSESI